MLLKNKAKKDMTKSELIAVITSKTKKIPTRFQPAVKRTFLNALKYKTRPQLKRIASRMRVEFDRTGYDIVLK
jgi:hypothetical protein